MLKRLPGMRMFFLQGLAVRLGALDPRLQLGRLLGQLGMLDRLGSQLPSRMLEGLSLPGQIDLGLLQLSPGRGRFTLAGF